MCLYSKTDVPKVAERDITVYKILLMKELLCKEDDGTYKLNRRFYAPIVYDSAKTYEYRKGINKTNERPRMRVVLENPDKTPEYQIDEGYLHAYGDFSPARYWATEWNNSTTQDKRYVVAEMIIPEGTEFFSSDDIYKDISVFGNEFATKKLYWNGKYEEV